MNVVTGETIMIPNYQQFGGKQIETAAASHLLTHAGVTAPHTNKPYSEALLFGIGGGIGTGYFVSVYEKEAHTSLFLATRITTHESDAPGFVGTIFDRVGVQVKVQHSNSPEAADKALRQSLAKGDPVMVWVNPDRLPYYGTPGAYHAVVVYGIDDERDLVHVADRSSKPLTLIGGEFRAARQAGEVRRWRTLKIEAVDRSFDQARLQQAILQGISDCCHQMREGFGPTAVQSNFGLKALPKWADLLPNIKDKRGWPTLFPAGEKLYDALTSAYNQIENRGSGGSAFRDLFADFLAEASVILNKPSLEIIVDQFHKAGRMWGELSAAMLPATEPIFAETARLLTRKRELFEAQGMDSITEVHRINDRLAELRSEAAQNFPLSAREVTDLLNKLRDHVLSIQRVEANAIMTLRTYLD